MDTMREQLKKNNIITVSDVVRAFPVAGGENFIAVNHVSLEIPQKSFAILRGRSGSGKTTLMNMLGALDAPTEGSIWFQDTDITKVSEKEREKIRRKNFGFVFQSVSLIPMMSAYENVEFALRMAGIKTGRKERVEECLKMVGLEKRMHHMPQEMSGGEQQRVAIARAVAHRPKVIFADEPTAELDSHTAVSVVKLFQEMVEEEGVTIIMTTHDVSLMDAGNLLFRLEDGNLIGRDTDE